MPGAETRAETKAQQELSELLGKHATPQTSDIRISDIDSLLDEERNAEIASKERAARFNSRALNQSLKQLKEEHELRKRFMPFVYWLVVGVIGSTIVLLMVSGIVSACGKTFLSDKVLITLLTATVADILGIFYIAIRWLYPKQTNP